jgi:hypothetical protein
LKKLIIRGFLFCLPLLVCLVFFLVDDPFGVFFKDNSLVESSEDVVKTRNYIKTYRDKRYASFIFGNSRTHGFHAKDWQEYIGTEAVYHFGAPGESLLNIRKKIELILAHGKLRNALIVIDAGILENTENKHPSYKGPVYNHTPLTSNISSFAFYSNYIRYYFDDFFFLKHIVYKLTHRYKASWMTKAFKEPVTEAENFVSSRYETLADSLIETNFQEYKHVFHPDYISLKRKPVSVSPEDMAHLRKIDELLIDQHVEYRVVIPPDFMGEELTGKAYDSLKAVLRHHLTDFSKFDKIRKDSTLNYENLHFTRRAGAMMLDSVYSFYNW